MRLKHYSGYLFYSHSRPFRRSDHPLSFIGTEEYSFPTQISESLRPHSSPFILFWVVGLINTCLYCISIECIGFTCFSLFLTSVLNWRKHVNISKKPMIQHHYLSACVRFSKKKNCPQNIHSHLPAERREWTNYRIECQHLLACKMAPSRLVQNNQREAHLKKEKKNRPKPQL